MNEEQACRQQKVRDGVGTLICTPSWTVITTSTAIVPIMAGNACLLVNLRETGFGYHSIECSLIAQRSWHEVLAYGSAATATFGLVQFPLYASCRRRPCIVTLSQHHKHKAPSLAAAGDLLGFPLLNGVSVTALGIMVPAVGLVSHPHLKVAQAVPTEISSVEDLHFSNVAGPLEVNTPPTVRGPARVCA